MMESFVALERLLRPAIRVYFNDDPRFDFATVFIDGNGVTEPIEVAFSYGGAPVRFPIFSPAEYAQRKLWMTLFHARMRIIAAGLAATSRDFKRLWAQAEELRQNIRPQSPAENSPHSPPGP